MRPIPTVISLICLAVAVLAAPVTVDPMAADVSQNYGKKHTCIYICIYIMMPSDSSQQPETPIIIAKMTRRGGNDDGGAPAQAPALPDTTALTAGVPDTTVLTSAVPAVPAVPGAPAIPQTPSIPQSG
ncbi:hypothetical protein BX666DRAFT_1888023 [Dichotomocladium elegans]|nr:hypothetical protein BX666DRAFT_1888023 [Dichotomocladium elegans]